MSFTICGAWEKVPHGSPDSKAVRGVAAEAGVPANGAETDKAGCILSLN